jgi:sporulation protein YlmC with PRC-barrel domain
MASDDVAADETHNLIAADKVAGAAVFNRDGERVGSIRTVMLNKRNGRVAYAVLESGGFLGIGADFYPVPWEALRYDTSLGGYRVDRNDFTDAPRYPQGSEPDWRDRLFHAGVRDYYGVPDATAI